MIGAAVQDSFHHVEREAFRHLDSDGRGHRQLIAGYYDVDDLSNFQNWDRAARHTNGVVGFMYTTWANKYSLLESYGEALRATRHR